MIVKPSTNGKQLRSFAQFKILSDYYLLWSYHRCDEDGELAVEEGRFEGRQVVGGGGRGGAQKEGIQPRGTGDRGGARIGVL